MMACISFTVYNKDQTYFLFTKPQVLIANHFHSVY